MLLEKNDAEEYGTDSVNQDPEAYGSRFDDVVTSRNDLEGDSDFAKALDREAKSISHAEDVSPVETVKRIVCFIDLLGTSNLMRSITERTTSDSKEDAFGVRKSDAEAVYEIVCGVKRCFDDFVAHLKAFNEDVSSMIISDSYVVSVPDDDDSEMFMRLINGISQFQKSCLLQYKQPTRGGIARGQMVAKDDDPNVIIGEALIFAHDLESKIAEYPRVIFNVDFKDDLEGKTSFPISKDKDKMWYVSYLVGTTDEELNQVIGVINEQRLMLDPHKNLREIQKWNWLETHVEQVRNKKCVCCQ